MNIADLIILVIFGAGTQTGRTSITYTLAQANLLYYRLIRFVLILLGLVTIGWLCNIWFDFRSINTFIALGFAIAAMIIAYRPINLAIVATAGGILSAFEKEKKDVGAGMRKFLAGYNNIVFEILAWGSLVFLVLFVAPLGNRPLMTFWGTLAIVIFYKIICQAWDFPGKLAKKIIYRVTQGIIVYCIIVLIPSVIYLKLFGFDLGGALIYSGKDEAIVKASNNLRDVEGKEVAKKISDLSIKVGSGKATLEERDELKKLIRENSFWEKTFGLVKSKYEERQAEEAKKKALEDIKKKVEASDPPTIPPAAKHSSAPAIKELVAEVEQARCPSCAMALKLGGKVDILIPPGDYHLEPPGRPDEIRFGLVGIQGLQALGDGRNFTVPEGKQVIGIRSPDQSRKVIAGKI